MKVELHELSPLQAVLFLQSTFDDSGAVHIWSVRVPDDWATVEALARGLPDDERRHAQGLLGFNARARFVATRAAVRGILSEYLGVAPTSLEFHLGAHGKPHLAQGDGPRLRFNVSHTRDLALCAVSWERDVGVDVEAHGSGLDLLRQASERIFAPEELERLRAATGPGLVALLYRGWSRKEAVLKAAGEGLAGPALPLLDVLSRPGSLVLRGDVPELAEGDWHVHDIDVGPGHSAAVAFRNPLDVRPGSGGP